MKRDPFGTYIETTTLGETVRAFVPPSLPPDPPLASSKLFTRFLTATAVSGAC